MTESVLAPAIRPASLTAIKAHARAAYPDECCGVVIDDDTGVQTVVRLRNVQDEMHARDPQRYPRTARTAYTPHAGEFKRAVDSWERPGCRLVAFYHSHPDHDAYFSDEDVAQATPFGEPSYPDALQVVVAVYRREVRNVRAYRWSDDTQRFVEIELCRA